nr:hypothetical protein [Tanacetum cinerariifolium]
MRVNGYNSNGNIDARKQAFNQWVLAVGDGKVPAIIKDGEDEPTWIEIPETFLIPSSKSPIQQIVEETYPNFIQRQKDDMYLRDRAILTLKNDYADAINGYMFEKQKSLLLTRGGYSHNMQDHLIINTFKMAVCLKKTIIPGKAMLRNDNQQKPETNKSNKQHKQVDGVKLSKPSLNLHYRKVDKGQNSSDNAKNIKEPNVKEKAVVDKGKVQVSNSFNALDNDDDEFWGTQVNSSLVNESDSEDIDENIILEEPKSQPNVNGSKGASTPDVNVVNV